MFSVLGFLAKETNKPIEEFATSGIKRCGSLINVIPTANGMFLLGHF